MNQPNELNPLAPPSNETQPPDSGPLPPGSPAGSTDAPGPSTTPPPPGPSPADAAPRSPSLTANPDRPAASDWREPAWFPPRDRSRDRRPNAVAIIVGLGLLAFGIYEFIDRTLGIALPRIQWGSLWPIILIVIGGLIVLRSMGRRP